MWQLAAFFVGEFRQNKINIANALAEIVVAGAKAKTWEIVGAKMRNGRFEAIIAAGATPLAEANLAELEVKIVADDQEILWCKLVIIANELKALADVVIKSLRLNEKRLAVLVIEHAVLLVFFPCKATKFRIKIQRQKTEVVTREIVFLAWITEAGDYFHKVYFSIKPE